MRLSELSDDDMPLSMLLAIQEGTCFWVFPTGCNGAASLLELSVGDILVWRGDLVHAGAGYAVDHVRVHAYIDPPREIYERPKDQTNRCVQFDI